MQSEKPTENQSTNHAKNDPPEKSGHTSNPISSIPATVESRSNTTCTHCDITCKTEKTWWDKTKPVIELFGVVLLLAYTIYTIKMYYTNRDSARAALSAANSALIQTELLRKQTAVSAAAVLKATLKLDGTSKLVKWGFKNDGHNAATGITGVVLISLHSIPADKVIGTDRKAPLYVPNLQPGESTESADIGSFHFSNVMNAEEMKGFEQAQVAVIANLAYTYNDGFYDVSDKRCTANLGFERITIWKNATTREETGGYQDNTDCANVRQVMREVNRAWNDVQSKRAQKSH